MTTFAHEFKKFQGLYTIHHEVVEVPVVAGEEASEIDVAVAVVVIIKVIIVFVAPVAVLAIV